VLAFFLKLVPKVGPFKALNFKIPTTQAENLYIASVDHTVENYKGLLAEVGEDKLRLANTDFDTGHLTHAGEYKLTDKAYAHLLDQLAQDGYKQVTPELRENILAFYGDPSAPVAAPRDPSEWTKTQDELSQLKAASLPEPPAIRILQEP
jgi:hypothetical protein